MSKFPKCCTFIRPLYGRFGHPWISDHRPWTLSMDDVHGRSRYRPWETLSFINHILVQEHPLVSLGGSCCCLLSWTWTIPMDELDMN